MNRFNLEPVPGVIAAGHELHAQGKQSLECGLGHAARPPSRVGQAEVFGVGHHKIWRVNLEHFGKLYLKVFEAGIAGLFGTHTHVPTLDAQILEGGVAYVSDVGMTGPSGGAQGYKPQGFINNMRSQGFAQSRLEHAEGPVELGAVLITLEGSQATNIQRILH